MANNIFIIRQISINNIDLANNKYFMHKIIGRKREIQQFQKLLQSKKSEFVAVYGRRRVGKTFLIREYFNYTFDFQHTGLSKGNTEQQLINFHNSLLRQNSSYSEPIPHNWLTAFQSLITLIEKKECASKKIIFLDELPWLDTAKSDFMMGLEHFWNGWASNRQDIILITSGSAASWMINTLINADGGLHNRITERMKLLPFDLNETEQLLSSKNCVLDKYQILQLYMVMGGIPFYLDAISSEKSANQNIEKMCFRKGAILQTEYKNLLASLFKKSENHEKIVFALSSKVKGMTRNEIVSKTKLSSGGGLTNLLNELEESGFIASYSPFNNKTKETIYRLSDFYCMFYHRFIKDNTNFDEGIWLNALDNPSHRAWAGYTFEQICLSHTVQIKKALGISGVQTSVSSWTSRTSAKGAQVDLVIDRRDQVVNLCEAKFSINPYTITKSYADNLRNKIGAFKAETKTRKSIFMTMITTFGLQKNEYSSSLVQNSISMEELFD